MKKPELLIPAGNLETLKTAVIYGADAVYIGGEAFSLRAKADNFDRTSMEEAIRYCHDRGKKLYVTVNIFARNQVQCHIASSYIYSICRSICQLYF